MGGMDHKSTARGKSTETAEEFIEGRAVLTGSFVPVKGGQPWHSQCVCVAARGLHVLAHPQSGAALVKRSQAHLRQGARKAWAKGKYSA